MTPSWCYYHHGLVVLPAELVVVDKAWCVCLGPASSQVDRPCGGAILLVLEGVVVIVVVVVVVVVELLYCIDLPNPPKELYHTTKGILLPIKGILWEPK